ncbi:MAG: hypothetical protein ABI707_11645, partial [Ferruginibacter sp.]
MKKFVSIMALILMTLPIRAQNIGIGTTSPNASAALEIKASTRGLLIPRTSTASRTAIVNPAKGLMVYDTTAGSFWFHNGSAWTQIGSGGSGWSLSGNAGINPATNFIGTTDARALLFRIKNTWAGIIDSALNNTAIGFKALKGSSTGSYNAAFGSNSLASSTPGNFNTAVGYSSLRNNGTGANFNADEGTRNTAVGYSAMSANTTGLYNTAVGFASLEANTSGYFNAAFGHTALAANVNGRDNTAVGLAALGANTNGQYNTATGSRALQENIGGSNNTGIG